MIVRSTTMSTERRSVLVVNSPLFEAGPLWKSGLER